MTGRGSRGPIAAKSPTRSRITTAGIRRFARSCRPSTFIWALFDRLPLQHWSRGPVTLLGDACHAMLPFMAQGAAQAMEDGATLAACLAAAASTRDIPDALARYEQLRQPRAARVHGMSAANKTRFHLPDGPEQENRDAHMASGSTDWSIDAVAWLYGHDAAASR